MEWSNLAKIVYARTYSRKDNGTNERWEDTVERVIRGNVRNHKVSKAEIERLHFFMMKRKASPAGRGLWFSGAPSHERLGGSALNNCWATTSEDWENFVLAQDLLMLGGGVGMSVEHRYTSKLPRVRRDVFVAHKATKDADFIVPDSREGWIELTRRVLESFFVTGKSFSYSTVCIRGAGEPINGFGGVASGPLPLVVFVDKLAGLLASRAGKTVRPIDAADILCSIGELVVSGNVRRSALILLGDPWDKEYLKAKRWDLGPIPNQRAMANFSVVCDDTDDLHPLFWKTYEIGEAFGIINRLNIQTYGRMGEKKKDTAFLTNPCGEALLEGGPKAAENCNLLELPLPRLADEAEFIEAARLMMRWGKRVTDEKYHWSGCEEIVKRNRRVGVGITGCLRSELFNPKSLDAAYEAILDEDRKYSKELGIPESIRHTVIKPSGTLSKLFDMGGYEGIHPAYSRYYIQRIRFGAADRLLPKLVAAGHRVEPAIRFDGSKDPNMMVADFYEAAPEGFPVADEGWDTWKQLDAVKMAQKHWADQSISVTVYYDRNNLSKIKTWLAENLCQIKTISFLPHSEHGFIQAPKEAISKENYEEAVQRLKPIEGDFGDGDSIQDLECAGGACPIK